MFRVQGKIEGALPRAEQWHGSANDAIFRRFLSFPGAPAALWAKSRTRSRL